MTIQLTGSIEAMLENLFSQILTLQQTILTRDENPGLPTPAEINTQCRLINCIDKLRRYHARLLKEAAAGNSLAEVASQLTCTPDAGTPPPITEQDFIAYRHLIGSFRHVTDTCTVRFRGRYVNTRWLEYNLYQYCLPEDERRFLNDEGQKISEADYASLQQKMKWYKSQSKKMAA